SIRRILFLCIFAFRIATAFSFAAENIPVRHPDEDVGSSAVRRRLGLEPADNLLFNGWGMTPAGEHVGTSDMPLKMLIAPDKKYLVAVSAGFNKHGVTLIDLATRK